MFLYFSISVQLLFHVSLFNDMYKTFFMFLYFSIPAQIIFYVSLLCTRWFLCFFQFPYFCTNSLSCFCIICKIVFYVSLFLYFCSNQPHRQDSLLCFSTQKETKESCFGGILRKPLSGSRLILFCRKHLPDPGYCPREVTD